MREAGLGSLVAIIFFYMLRAGETIEIDPTKGLIIGVIWLFFTSTPLIGKIKRRESQTHAVGNIVVAIIVSSTLAVMLDMVTMETIWSFGFFGSAAWLGTLLAVPTAQFFDKHNISNIYQRWYYRKR